MITDLTQTYLKMHKFRSYIEFHRCTLSPKSNYTYLFQSGEASRRYESFGRTCKNINPPNDLTAFVKTLHIPDTMTVSKHIFQPPTNKAGQVPLQVKCYIFTRYVFL